MDMSAFTFLAGFLSSRAASAKPITVEERRRFYINRLGVMHTFFVFSAVFSLPAFFLRCGPGQCRQAVRDPNLRTSQLSKKFLASSFQHNRAGGAAAFVGGSCARGHTCSVCGGWEAFLTSCWEPLRSLREGHTRYPY